MKLSRISKVLFARPRYWSFMNWNFRHLTSSPATHKTIERSKVQPSKNLRNHHEEGSSEKVWSLSVSHNYRNTPTDVDSSLAQRLFRRTRNLLPLAPKQLEPVTVPPQDVQQTLIASRQKQAYYDNLKGKALPELQLGQIVKMKKLIENIWTEAVCKKMIGPQSYAVVSGNRSSHMLRMVVRSSLGVHNPLRILNDRDLFQTIQVQQLFLLIWHPVLP